MERKKKGMLNKGTQIKLTLNVKINCKIKKSILPNVTFIYLYLSVILKNGMIFVAMEMFFR